MNRFLLGIQALFRIWSDAAWAGKVAELMEGPAEDAKAPVLTEAPPPARRSEALTLLAVLQREGRLVDFLKETLDGYADAQVGAAARDVHKQCAAALDRMFGLEPVRPEPEGATVTVPPGFDPAEVRVMARSSAATHGAGTLMHGGWRATRVALPEWQGRPGAAMVIAPCEVELA